MTDIIDAVLQDHLDIATQLDGLQAATAPRGKVRLCARLHAALECHLVAEETVLYPRIRKGVTDANEAIDGAVEEHGQIRASMNEVEARNVGTQLFDLAVVQLAAITFHHVFVEEGELLPDFYEGTDVSERESLGAMYEDAKAHVYATDRALSNIDHGGVRSSV